MSRPDFVNGYGISTNNITGDTIFTFYSAWTDLGDDNQPIDRRDEVAKIVMSYGGVKSFSERLKVTIDGYEKADNGE